MAKKKQNLLEDPPTANSSDVDEGQEVEEQISSDDSSSNEEEGDDLVKTPSGKKPNPSSSAAVSRKSAALNKISGSVSRSEKPKDNKSSPAAKSGRKRKNETPAKNKQAKRAKKKKVTGHEEKKPALNRIWSEEDEITLLQGMIDFKAETGKSPYEDTNAFYELAMKSICFNASKNQFMDKIRSLKRKYLGKKKDTGSYTRDHDKECLRLANYIWGSDGMALDSAAKPKRKLDSVEEEEVEEEGDREVNGEEEEEEGNKEEEEVMVNGEKGVEENGKEEVEEEEEEEEKTLDLFEESFVVGSIVGLGVNEEFLKRKWRTAPMETRKRIEEKLKSVHAKEIQVVAGKTDIMKDISAMLAE